SRAGGEPTPTGVATRRPRDARAAGPRDRGQPAAVAARVLALGNPAPPAVALVEGHEVALGGPDGDEQPVAEDQRGGDVAVVAPGAAAADLGPLPDAVGLVEVRPPHLAARRACRACRQARQSRRGRVPAVQVAVGAGGVEGGRLPVGLWRGAGAAVGALGAL